MDDETSLRTSSADADETATSPSPGSSDSASRAAFCTRCGVSPEAGDHATCQRWLASEEPPRYCAQCGRRMKVQIIPTGWAATCSRHGEISGGAGV